MFMTTWITMDQERKPNIGYIESIRYEKCVTLSLFLYTIDNAKELKITIVP